MRRHARATVSDGSLAPGVCAKELRAGLDALEQRRQRNLERVGNARQMSERRIAVPALNTPHVRAVHPRLICKRFLGQTLFLTEVADSVADGRCHGFCAFQHAQC